MTYDRGEVCPELTVWPFPLFPRPRHASLDLHVSGLAFGFCYYCEYGIGWQSTSPWRPPRRTDSLEQTALEVFLSRTLFFQIRNKYTELQVCKLHACVCIGGGNIYCITQRVDMKLEDTLFRAAIVRLHTNKGSFHMQLDYAEAALEISLLYSKFSD